MNLKKNEILMLFNASVENANALFDAAYNIALNYDKQKFPSLGLAELALEELGKSYSLLAYYSKADHVTDWKVFWKEWKDHELKAHRGFFYEFFCTIRIEMVNTDTNQPEAVIPRGMFSKEKEAAFYVDIDKGNRKIHIPTNEIGDQECIARVLSLIGLLNPVLYIKEWFNSDKSDSFKNAISDYAYITITTEMYQQDVEQVLDSMKSNNADYNVGLAEIWNMFKTKTDQQ